MEEKKGGMCESSTWRRAGEEATLRAGKGEGSITQYKPSSPEDGL